MANIQTTIIGDYTEQLLGSIVAAEKKAQSALDKLPADILESLTSVVFVIEEGSAGVNVEVEVNWREDSSMNELMNMALTIEVAPAYLVTLGTELHIKLAVDELIEEIQSSS